MQTFLPYADFNSSAACLGQQHLGKQRVEGLQILMELTTSGTTSGSWGNHPAVLMWRHHIRALSEYVVACCDEWKKRGYRDNIRSDIDARISWMLNNPKFEQKIGLPLWLGVPELHASHRSNLIRKKPEIYQHLWPGTQPDLEYWWPTHNGF